MYCGIQLVHTFYMLITGAVREAIDDMRRNNVSAFVLDLRDNRLHVLTMLRFILSVACLLKTFFNAVAVYFLKELKLPRSGNFHMGLTVHHRSVLNF